MFLSKFWYFIIKSFDNIFILDEEPLYYQNFDLDNVISLVDFTALEQLLQESTNYDVNETKFLVKGFRDGFEIGYEGRCHNIQRRTPNLKICVGSPMILWNKIMKEVKNKRFAGPYHNPPFRDFIQSLVGLVPKDSGRDMRLIFHLSYPCNGSSINSETPKSSCSVDCCDFSEAVRACISHQVGKSPVFVGKSDYKSAFRNLWIWALDWPLLIFMAVLPLDGRVYYFVDKCLPFGASISCSHFQHFSDAVAHIL